MKTQQQREAIAGQLLPYLLEMALDQKPQIIASTDPIQEITLNDLLKLTDAELETLQKLVEKTKSAKKSLEKSAKYGSTVGRGYTITDGGKPKHQIIDKSN